MQASDTEVRLSTSLELSREFRNMVRQHHLPVQVRESYESRYEYVMRELHVVRQLARSHPSKVGRRAEKALSIARTYRDDVRALLRPRGGHGIT